MSRRDKRRSAIQRNEQYDNYSYEEKHYYKHLDEDKQAYIIDQENEMTAMDTSKIIPLRFQILESGIDKHNRALAIQQLNHLQNMDSSSGEYHKILKWIEAICRVPFGKYQPLPVTNISSKDDIKAFIKNIQETMNTKVYGHKSAKDQIIRLLAQWISNPQSKGLVIGIQGSMGTGKTTLIKDAICKVLGLPFALIPLGGISDGSFLVGHGYTYEGSTWGRIVDMLMKCECMNPVIFFDELDKVSTTRHGEEIINILMHMTDATQNESFTDKYFSNMEFDLSRSLIIFSYNDENNINPILRDRMVKIHTNGYNMRDKFTIAQKHLIPATMSEFGLKDNDIIFTEEILKTLINMVDEEEGVRNLKRAIHDVISNVNLVKLLTPEEISENLVITDDHLKKFIQTKKKCCFNTMYL